MHYRHLRLLVLPSLLCSVSACSLFSKKEEAQPFPKWEGKVYAGDSKLIAITRAQSSESIACSDPKFDRFLCLSEADAKELMMCRRPQK